jgi:hypothetical protein
MAATPLSRSCPIRIISVHPLDAGHGISPGDSVKIAYNAMTVAQ